MTFVTQLGKRISENTGDNQDTAYLLQRMSIAIQRCNAICFVAVLRDTIYNLIFYRFI